MNGDKIKIQNVMTVIAETQDIDLEYCSAELSELVRTACGAVKLTVVQKRNTIDPFTVVGSGKLQEIKELLEASEEKIDVVIFANSLNSLQRRNIRKVLECLVIDKTDLILDIFALRAVSAEGKKQVELAQLSYVLATRNEDAEYTRQGGGIGTRGPGETKLETNKRATREKIQKLKRELSEMDERRELLRKTRTESDIFVVAFVGYTNAGKSTLFNRLTDNNVYADNLLFATLDTTTRKTKLPNGVEILFTDTVGFIKDLPHQLINAFKSTLEETVNADLILNVCDISDTSVDEHIKVTENMLSELGVNAPILRVYNKIDRQTRSILSNENGSNMRCVFVSALSGQNIDVLSEEITGEVMKNYLDIKIKAGIEQNGKLLNMLHRYASVFTLLDDTCDDGIYVRYRVVVAKKYLKLFAEMLDLT